MNKYFLKLISIWQGTNNGNRKDTRTIGKYSITRHSSWSKQDASMFNPETHGCSSKASYLCRRHLGLSKLLPINHVTFLLLSYSSLRFFIDNMRILQPN